MTRVIDTTDCDTSTIVCREAEIPEGNGFWFLWIRELNVVEGYVASKWARTQNGA
jgi:hypothetical protein